MKDNYSKIEKISNEGYQLEFGTVLENAFENYKKIALIGGLGTVVTGIIVMAVFIGFFGIIYGFSDFVTSLSALNPEFMSGTSLLFFFLFIVFFAALLSPLNAGFTKMAYQAHYGHRFGLETIFEYFKSSHYKDLFIAAAIITFFGNGINYLLNYFGIFYIGALFTYVVAFLTFLTVPLIIFSNLNAIQAISMSIKLVLKQPLVLLGLLIVAVVFAALGLIGFCIGIFFTVPFIYSMYFTIYNAIIPLPKGTQLDEIGQNQE